MRILVVGAGATGGAFGTLLQEAGRDVTFLVRERKAEALRRDGLRFVTPDADRTHPVQVITTTDTAPAFDLVLITVKATAFSSAVIDVHPFIDAHARILPVLNGMAHIDQLQAAYPGQVLGGLARIVATLDGDVVHQKTSMSSLMVGSLTDAPVADDARDALDVPGIDFSVADDVVGALWDKWAFIAAASVINCLFHAPVGRILDAGGEGAIRAAIDELEAVAARSGHPVSGPAHHQAVALLTEPGSSFTTSLYRDLTAGLPSEVDHILGDYALRATALQQPTPLLDLTLIAIRANLPD
ncbi:ketopantoate reductase family protein [Arthrobacter antioxidans]|uniref:ketopantoate reductase family protein n=1 Tax=Arthrobacter antioxidans TaxID=2895818 RepID=UPI001FFEE585|nr:2-dehydropantoate 2-reductase [Arthrobacter antioxidans]